MHEIVYPRESSDLRGSKRDLAFCYELLDRVSRSFAAVIRQLPPELADATCLFYLALRGLDTVEDDMSLALPQKRAMLESFHRVALEPGWQGTGLGDTEDYRFLMRNFDEVNRALASQSGPVRSIVDEICRDMGHGMSRFAAQELVSEADYNLYCHYVAGLVGRGLSELFVVTGVEAPDVGQDQDRANSMGLFLQKTNIIRDYWEDFALARHFWPRDVWSRYVTEFGDLHHRPQAPESLACVNYMVTEALAQVTDCLEYLDRLRHPDVFRFCAVPQVMAVLTLAQLYDNPEVFTTNVKISRERAAVIFTSTSNMDAVEDAFLEAAEEIRRKVRVSDPGHEATLIALEALDAACGIAAISA